MSLADEAARTAQSTSAAQPESSGPSSSAVNLPDTMTAPLSNANESDKAVAPASGDESAPLLGNTQDEDDEDEDEEEMMRRAMAMSRGDSGGDDVVMAEEGEGDDDEDEDAAIARAIQMSLEEGKDQKDETK